MQVKLLDGRMCDVLSRHCRFLACLQPGYTTHRSAGSSWTGNVLECTRWTERGCPPESERRVRDELSFHQLNCTGPRYPFVPRSERGVVRCRSCGNLIPKIAILKSRSRDATKLGVEGAEHQRPNE
jgi:hypothetical protein